MVRRLTLIFFMIFMVSVIFPRIVVTPESSVVSAGGVLPITVEYLSDKGEMAKGVLKAEASVGGFYEIDLMFGGISIDGSATVNYLAPYAEGNATIVFYVDNESTEIQISVREERVNGTKIGVKVEDFSGNVAYKKADSEIWKPVDIGVELSEGDSLLTMKDSYVVLKFPNESETKVLENTQLKIEKLEKVGEGYVVELKQLKGKTYNSIQKLLKSGERFLIKTKSVTAGVRGTKFSVLYENDKPKIVTFEGTVFAYTTDGAVYPVPAGKEFAPGMTRPENTTHTEKEFETKKPAKEEKKEVKKEEKEEETKQGKEEKSGIPGVSVGAGQPNVFVGNIEKGEKPYIMYSFSQPFNIGPLWLDIGINAYSDKIGGELYYGLPSSTPSTNVLDAITINGIGISFGESFIKYGNMSMYDLGMSYAMRGYTVPFAKAIDFQIGYNGYKVYVHVPYELTKLSEFSFERSDSIWFGEFSWPLLGMEGFVSGIYDTAEATPASGELFVDKSISAGIRKSILIGSIGVEGNVQLTEDSRFAYGIFGGWHGRVGMFEFIAGAYGSFAGHHPFLFDRFYYEKRIEGNAPGIYADSKITVGYLAGFEFYWTYVKGKMYLSGDFDGNVTLDGSLRGIVPAIGDSFNGLLITGYLHDETPFKNGGFSVFEENGDTKAWLSISYPIMGESLTAGFKFEWDSSTGEWKKLVIIGADFWR